ncbi:L-serine ammonia-lyase [Propionibacteriaceae bacterium G1746]|uniref:L-serine ammonia-lyase n=1 Tax=Aestuariimicrobium sp. G57 TaxID=3418485 RepID=UPI003D5CD519
MFKVGIGPSSSHTVGPMVAARRFVTDLRDSGLLTEVRRVEVTLCGSLGATGRGHASDRAVVMGLEGARPRSVDLASFATRLERLADDSHIGLAANVDEAPHPIDFDPDRDLLLVSRKRLPRHPNGMVFTAELADGETVERTYFSVGGGFVVEGDEPEHISSPGAPLPHPFDSAAQLLQRCHEHGWTIPQLALENERALGVVPAAEVEAEVAHLWQVMSDCIDRGLVTHGTLPGRLAVRRRAPELHQRLLDQQIAPGHRDELATIDWLGVWAMAVNEENAASGRVVTAPTNGAAGVIPAVLRHVVSCAPANPDQVVLDFLLTASAVGSIIRRNASISGADVGCQGEVGSAAAMAAAGFAQVEGGTPEQVLNAAEIAMEHHLGMTCDPVGGLVQIPCIERNAMGAVKALMAARLALSGGDVQKVSFDTVVETMLRTGRDMSDKYKETSTGGLAVSIIEC